MKPSPGGTARELEPQAPARGEPRAVEPEGRWREKGEADTERQRTRERQEATLAGLAELEYLRQRQELLVRSALRDAGGAGAAAPRAGELPGEAAQRSRLEEKFLEENILLLRKQLNCLRRRDAGLLNQLQELDKQISDLRLDVKTSEEHLETDSRPSSGFYELSDGASGSLSNSSNSVFSECLSTCHSSTCFCSPLEATLTISDGCPKSADLLRRLEFREGQCEDQASGAVGRSPCAPPCHALDVIADVNPKYQCDLVSKNGSDVYRYPSPLHAVAVQSPMFLLCLTGSPREEERLGGPAAGDAGAGAEPTKADGSLPSPSGLWPAPQPCASRKMDGYILSLVQKKTHPVRTNKPRTSVSADPMKGLLRNGSVCVRAAGGGGSQGAGATPKAPRPPCAPSGGLPSLDHSGALSPPKQWAKESKAEQLEGKRLPPPEPGAASELQSKHLPQNAKPATQEPARGAAEPLKDTAPIQAASPTDSPARGPAALPESKAAQPLKKAPQKAGPPPAAAAPPLLPTAFPVEDRPALDFKSEGSSSQSLEEGHLVKAQFIPGQPPGVRPHRGHRSAAVARSATLRHRGPALQGLESGLPPVREKTRAASKKCRFPDDLDTNKKLKKASSKGRKGGVGPPDGGLPARPPGSVGAGHRAGSRAHGHGREAVVAKPKHKRTDYRRWKSSAEISYEEALRRARRGRREHVGAYPSPVALPYASPYAYVASDSEYSAECESLFHSTVVDTSEDEQSNYTTNCFGDSESSVSEGDFVGESTTTSDSEESGALIWSQFVQTLPLQAVAAADLHHNPRKTFVKIKASHNLKKKILRFRSGSLKLMTTV